MKATDCRRERETRAVLAHPFPDCSACPRTGHPYYNVYHRYHTGYLAVLHTVVGVLHGVAMVLHMVVRVPRRVLET